MIIINRPKTAFAYSLHDATIRKITIKKHRVIFHVSHLYQFHDGQEILHKARISFLEAETDICNIQIFKEADKKGRISGKEYSLRKFIKKYPKAKLEITTECYNGYDTILEGYLYRRKKWYFFHLQLWNRGDIQYVITDSRNV